MNIALLSGHAKTSEGATCCHGRYKGIGEHALASLYLPLLRDHLTACGHTVALTCREDAGGTTPSFSAAAANATEADIALEFHFNSHTAPTTSGCEVLYWGKSYLSRKFAIALSARLAKILGVHNRGAKPVYGPADRGYLAFRRSKMSFFIIEPCFAGSNPDDARIFGDSIHLYSWQKYAAQAINETIAEVYQKRSR